MKKLLALIKKLLGSSDSSSSSDSSKGFTLIELLIVIAVIGVLAAAVLVAIDPVEQLARGRDAGRKTTISQLGRGVQDYYTASGAFPLVAQWTNTAANVVVASGDLKIFPSAPGVVANEVFTCGGGSNANRYCYKLAGANYVIYTPVESKSELSKNAACGTTAAPTAWYTYASALGKAGLVCQPGEPAAGFSGTMF